MLCLFKPGSQAGLEVLNPCFILSLSFSLPEPQWPTAALLSHLFPFFLPLFFIWSYWRDEVQYKALVRPLVSKFSTLLFLARRMFPLLYLSEKKHWYHYVILFKCVLLWGGEEKEKRGWEAGRIDKGRNTQDIVFPDYKTPWKMILKEMSCLLMARGAEKGLWSQVTYSASKRNLGG